MEKNKAHKINELVFQAQGRYYGHFFIDFMRYLRKKKFPEPMELKRWEKLKKEADESLNKLEDMYRNKISKTTNKIFIKYGKKYFKSIPNFNFPESLRFIVQQYSIPIFRRVVRGDEPKAFSSYIVQKDLFQKNIELNYKRVGGLYKRWQRVIKGIGGVMLDSHFSEQMLNVFFESKKDMQDFYNNFSGSLTHESMWVCHEIMQMNEVKKRNYSFCYGDVRANNLLCNKNNLIKLLIVFYALCTMKRECGEEININKDETKTFLERIHAEIEKPIPASRQEDIMNNIINILLLFSYFIRGSTKMTWNIVYPILYVPIGMPRNLTTYLFGHEEKYWDGELYKQLKNLFELEENSLADILGVKKKKKKEETYHDEKNYSQAEDFSESKLMVAIPEPIKEMLEEIKEEFGDEGETIFRLRVIGKDNWGEIAKTMRKSRKTLWIKWKKIKAFLTNKYPRMTFQKYIRNPKVIMTKN